MAQGEKRFHVWFKGKEGRVRMSLYAKDREQARLLAERAHYRRHERFPLTFARLEEAKETGRPGLLAIDPRFGGKALTEAWVKAEIERRKRDQGRYDDAELKIDKIEEAKD
jgi:hypothetical protein